MNIQDSLSGVTLVAFNEIVCDSALLNNMNASDDQKFGSGFDIQNLNYINHYVVAGLIEYREQSDVSARRVCIEPYVLVAWRCETIAIELYAAIRVELIELHGSRIRDIHQVLNPATNRTGCIPGPSYR